jgi:histidinol-phosphate aminotransferase
MNYINKLIRPDLQDYSAYSSARSIKSDGTIWLNANEWPWNDKESITIEKLNRYPQQQPELLQRLLASRYNVSEDQLLITRGSDEGIDLLIKLFCSPSHDNVIICPPTFSMYQHAAKLQAITTISVPLIENEFSINVDGVKKSVTSTSKLLFLCSPNNPTGNIVATDDVITLCNSLEGIGCVVVDEAYIEFSEQESVAKLINSQQNLVVLRTLSKAYGMAAARVGAVLANKEIIQWLRKIMPPYPIPSLSAAVAMIALSEDAEDDRKQKIALILSEREKLFQSLVKLRIVKNIWPSQGNFLLVQFSQDITLKLIERGIILRDMSDATRMSNTMRISIGKPEENKIVLQVLEEIAP